MRLNRTATSCPLLRRRTGPNSAAAPETHSSRLGVVTACFRLVSHETQSTSFARHSPRDLQQIAQSTSHVPVPVCRVHRPGCSVCSRTVQDSQSRCGLRLPPDSVLSTCFRAQTVVSLPMTSNQHAHLALALRASCSCLLPSQLRSWACAVDMMGVAQVSLDSGVV